MKLEKSFILTAILFVASAYQVCAVPNNLNNKFGISLLQPSAEHIQKASELVNSNGGNYGYVTLVIQENDRDRYKWQEILDQLRKYRLIPIIRLATKPVGQVWERPEKEDVDGWIDFLDSLNWVVKERYIVLFNEPNHAAEWGGEVDPENYAQVAKVFAQKLKERNRDFFIMLAGFDASAPSYPTQYEDEEKFIQQMLSSEKALFDYIDGLASHSYPNPGFSGSPWDRGRKSIYGYDWELSVIKKQGISKELPVFITETGWINNCSLSTVACQNTIAQNYRLAYDKVWTSDERVVAVTPFVFDYQTQPFLGFSWKKQGEDAYYPHYYEVQAIPKEKGEPVIIEQGTLEHNLPGELVANSNYRFTLKLKNTGQAIWDEDEGYKLSILNSQGAPFDYLFSDIKNLKPFQETNVSFYLKTTNQIGAHKTVIALTKNDRILAETDPWNFTVFPLPSLEIRLSLLPKIISSGNDYEVQIFNDAEEVVYKKSGFKLQKDTIKIDEVQNVVLGKTYRLVVLKKYYLPRQSFVRFKKENNMVKLKKMLPLDFNMDGRAGWGDVQSLIQKPSLFRLLVP